MTDRFSTDETAETLERKNRRLVGRTIRFFFFAALLIVIYQVGVEVGKNSATDDATSLSPSDTIFLNTESRDKTLDFSLFWKVWDILKDKYVDRANLDSKELFYGAIDGMLAATGDPYTTFFDPKEQKEFNEDISGKFEGIGAEMGIRDDILTVIAPLDDAPAAKAGLLANDKVLKINNESTATLSLDEAVSKIRGPKGTEVRLTIYRSGEEESQEVSVIRDVISVKSVKLSYKDDGIALLRVSRFGDDTEREFRAMSKELSAKDPQGIIIDLRNNPGGLLDTSIEMASTMLPAGKTVVIEENGKGERREDKARGGDLFSGIPTVVLINEGSASASEILAGALRDNRDNVTVIGKKSFGKGSVQELIPVTKDMSVKITVARWLTPNGDQINDHGISPDTEIGLSLDDIKNDRDPQMDKAVEILTVK